MTHLDSRKNQRGHVIVESALIFIVFFAMLIGAFDFGQFLFLQQALLERGRYAARWGAVNDPTNTTAIQNMVLYNQSANPPSGTATYFNIPTTSVAVTTSGSGTDNYMMTLVISGYTYKVYSLWIAGTYTGPPVNIVQPLGRF
jgi:Flp pilus assembly protein TadG